MAVPPFLRRLSEPGRPERAVLFAAVLGAAALINPARLSPARRAGYRAGLATASAATVASDTPRELGGVNRAALAAAAAGATLGFAELGESIDAKLHGALVRRGVRTPRLALAATTVALSLLGELPSLLEARRNRAAARHSGAADPAQEYGELPAGARSLIAGMLDFSADRGSAALRTQLAAAREHLGEDPSGAYSAIDIDFEDTESLPRVVPHQHVFPVIARFDDPDTGARREVRLDINEGRLSALRIDEVTDADDYDWDDEAHARSLWPSAWPARAEVTFSLESNSPEFGPGR